MSWGHISLEIIISFYFAGVVLLSYSSWVALSTYQNSQYLHSGVGMSVIIHKHNQANGKFDAKLESLHVNTRASQTVKNAMRQLTEEYAQDKGERRVSTAYGNVEKSVNKVKI